MIVVLSSSPNEGRLLQSLCEFRRWPCNSCATLEQFQTLAENNATKVLVMRSRLGEGYSDDVFSYFRKTHLAQQPWTIVLMRGDSSSTDEARQIALGADCVLRDPVRIDVLLEYVAKYREASRARAAQTTDPISYRIGNVLVFPQEHRIQLGAQSVHVAPQEIGLLRLLAHSDNHVVSYASLYSQLFNRRFDGNTTNSRVLLGKVVASFKRLGVDLRKCVQVIAKSGYRYHPTVATLPKAATEPAQRVNRTRARKRTRASASR